MRLRELGISVGQLPVGARNEITDVTGVRVGHVDIDEAGLTTGITAVLPYATKARKLFVGRYGLDGGDGMSGLGVTEDFGAISTPVMLGPAAAVGKVYDAIISRGLGIDTGLSEDAGWPPVVIGVDDSWLNPPATVHQLVSQEHANRALAAAAQAVSEGSHGIGRGLAAFGGRGGIGTSSRLCTVAGQSLTIGALVAANGGEPDRLSVDGLPLARNLEEARRRRLHRDVPRTLAAVIITDAPLIPRQLERLAGRASFGLARPGALDGQTRDGLILALSTTGLQEAGDIRDDGTVAAAMVGESELTTLFTAAMEACEESLLNALLQAEPLPHRRLEPFHLEPLAPGDWVEAVRAHQHSMVEPRG
jgi:D-aminopeptidase